MSQGGSVSIKVLLDTANFTQGVNKVKSDLEKLKTGNVDKIDTSMKDAAKSAEELSGGAEKAAESFDGLGDSAGKAGEKIDKAGKQGKGATDPISEPAKQGGRNWDEFARKAESAGKTLQSVGAFATKAITLPMAAIGAASVAAAVTIDTSLTNVRKTVDGTEQDYQNLKQAAIEFSKTNAVSASQMLDIQALGAQLGFSLSELREFGEVVSSLEISTNMGADHAAEEMAHFANITGLAHDEIRNYGSAIVDLGNHFATTESDISAMALRIASAGSQAGMSQADILGLATALSSVGIEAEAGGTAISQIMIKISNDVAKNTENLQTWAETAGMSAEQFADRWKSSPVEALSAVLAGMNDATQESGKLNLILDDLGITGIRQGDTLRRLAGAYDMTTEAVKTANKAWVENTALQAEVDNRNNSLAAKFEMVKNRVTAVAEEIGVPFCNALLAALDAAEPLFQAIESGAQTFADMDESQQQLILGAVGIAMAFGPAASAIGSFSSGLGGFIGNIKDLGNAFSIAASGGTIFSGMLTALPFALAAAGIAAVLALIPAVVQGFAEAATNADNFNEATEGLHNSVSSLPGTFEASADALGNYAEKADEAALSVKELIAQQAELSQSIAERNSAANDDIQAMQKYGETIDKLGGRADLTQEQVLTLKRAVENLNAATGSNYTVSKDAQGAYQVMADGATVAKDAIHELIDAMKLQREAEAMKDNLVDISEQKAEAVKTQAKAEDQLKQAIEEQNAVAGQNIEIQQAAAEKVAAAARNYQAAQKAAEEIAKAEKAVEDNLRTLTMAQEENANGYTKIVAASAAMRSSLIDNNESTVEFTKSLERTGVSVDQFKELGETKMTELAMAYDGSIGSIVDKLGEFGISIDENLASSIDRIDEFTSDADIFKEKVQQAFSETGLSITDFAAGMVEAGVRIEDFRNLSEDQLAQVVSAYGVNTEAALSVLQSFAEQNRAKGTEAVQNWLSGFSEKTQEMASAAAEAAGQSLQEFYDTAPEYAKAGEDGLLQYIKSLSSSDGSGGEAAVDNEVNAMEGREGEFSEIGESHIEAYNEGWESGSDDAASNAVDNQISNLQGREGDFQNIGDSYGTNLGEGVSTGASNSSADALRGMLDQLSGANGEARAIGVSLGNALSSGFAAADMASTTSAIQNLLASIASYEGEFNSTGNNMGTQFADGVKSADGEGAGTELANAANSGASSVDGTSAGANFGAGFVAGIRSYIGAAIAAATELVNAAKAAADAAADSHSPSREMIKRGKWFVQGFALGVKKNLKLAYGAGRDAVAEAINGADTYTDFAAENSGQNFAQTFVEGVKSGLEELPKTMDSALSQVMTKLEVFRAKQTADRIRETMSNLSGDALTEFIWGHAAPWTKNKQYTRASTGNVYDSMQNIEKAGYASLEAYLKAKEEIAKKQKAWDEEWADYEWDKMLKLESLQDAQKKLDEARADGDADKIQQAERAVRNAQHAYDQIIKKGTELDEEWNQFLADMARMEELGNSLTASVDDMQKWQPLYQIKKELNESIDSATEWSSTLAGLTNRTGINFSKNFVDRIVKGGDEAREALKLIATSSDADIQRLVNAYDDLARAERESEIEQRSMWVNSLPRLKEQAENTIDWLLDFREACLDVKEALYTDDGFAAVVEKMGLNVEDLAKRLQESGMTMKDYQAFWDELLGRKEAVVEWSATIANALDNMGGFMSKNVMEALAQGGEDLLGILSTMQTVEEYKALADAIDAATRAEREQAIAQREMALQIQETEWVQAADKVLDFKEAVLDLREAISGNAVVKQVMSELGLSAEDLTKRLQDTGIGIEEYASFWDSLSDSLSKANGWTQAVTSLFSEAGLTFSDGFVRLLAQGDEALVKMLQTCSNADEMQVLIDYVTKASIAEREAAVAQRELTLSIQEMNIETEAEQLVAFKEAVLDLREAISGDSVVQQAMSDLGISAEELTRRLQESGMSIADYASFWNSLAESLSKANGWTDAVTSMFNEAGLTFSDGFVRVLAQGDEMLIKMLQTCSNADEMQVLIDYVTQASIAEREAAIAQRELTLSIKDMNIETEAEQLLSFKEAVVSLKEAISGDTAMQQVMSDLGLSAEELTRRLQKSGMSIADYAGFWDSLSDSLSKANGWTETVTSIFNEAGLTFSDGFVRALAQGDETLVKMLQTCASADEMQVLIDYVTQASIAEREAAVAQRELTLSIKDMNVETEAEQLIAFKEAVLDLKEAISGDVVIQQVMNDLGLSAEELTRRLQKSGVSISDYQKYFDNLIGTKSSIQTWAGTVGTLFSTAGIRLSKGFVEKVIEGDEALINMLQTMQSVDEIQTFINYLDEASRAEREQAIAQRELMLEVDNLSFRDPYDDLLSFKELCLDVKEELASNDGLATGFKLLGVTVEEFAAGLKASGYTMSEFTGYWDNFVSSVTDGFKGLQRDNQTDLTLWIHTLENNIVEAEHWAANLENVFSRAGGEGVDAFRSAVLEGGFSKFGQIITQLADASTDDINRAIETYWQALKTGQTTGLASFMEVSGSELAANAVDGITEGVDIIAEQMRELIDKNVEETSKQAESYSEVGKAITEFLASGIIDNAELPLSSFEDIYQELIDSGYIKADSFRNLGNDLSAAVGEGIISGMPFIQSALDSVLILKDQAVKAANEAVAAAQRAASVANTARGTRSSSPYSSLSAPYTAVNWYATGGIFDKASIIGVGEAGREAVIPLSGAAMQPFASAIAQQINNNGDQISSNVTLNAQVTNLSTAEHMARKVGLYTNREARKRGRRRA